MAVLPLNTFKTITKEITTQTSTIYSCPVGRTAIVLMAQVSNVSVTSNTSKVTFSHVRQRTATQLVQNCPVPPEDARSVLTGRLVLEQGDRIEVSADANNRLKIVISVVESANT